MIDHPDTLQAEAEAASAALEATMIDAMREGLEIYGKPDDGLPVHLAQIAGRTINDAIMAMLGDVLLGITEPMGAPAATVEVGRLAPKLRAVPNPEG